MKKHTVIILNASAWLLGCGGAFVATIFAVLQPDMNSQLQAWRVGQTERFTQPWQLMDQVLGKTSSTGNIGVVFSGFDPNSLSAINAAQLACHRIAFAIYPRRLYSSWDGTIFRGGKTVLENRFDPDIPWLQQRDIHTVILFTKGPDDSFNVNFADIPVSASAESTGRPSQGAR